MVEVSALVSRNWWCSISVDQERSDEFNLGLVKGPRYSQVKYMS